jgi:serine/threonine-protein phosphatase 2A regulatory subunit B''
MVASAAIKMDELLTSWLASDAIYENVMRVIEQQKESRSPVSNTGLTGRIDAGNNDGRPPLSPNQSSSLSSINEKKTRMEIPPFFRKLKEPATVDSSEDDVNNQQAVVVIPPPPRRMRSAFTDDQTWDGIYMANREGGGDDAAAAAGAVPNSHDLEQRESSSIASGGAAVTTATPASSQKPCISLQAKELFQELGITTMQHRRMMMEQQQVEEGESENEKNKNHNVSSIIDQYLQSTSEKYHTSDEDCIYVPIESFERITKELCNLPTFFHKPLYARILLLWESYIKSSQTTFSSASSSSSLLPSSPTVVTYGIFHYYWITEMAPYDMNERFFRLLKQPNKEYISRDDFFPYIRELLNDHPGLEFLSNHAEFQEKYAVTVVTRIFYSVNLCHSGRITSRQIRKSNLLSVFQQVDEEDDINKEHIYFSYEHFYVLYCRFWELDHDRDYKITREDLLKYGDHCLSHMIVDRIFSAAPRPFEGSDASSSSSTSTTLDANGNVVVVRKQPSTTVRDYLTYEDFIFFMLSEEDKANERSVRYWFTCVDVDGDDKLNNMEMRSFYAVQLHRMQCMGHEVVPFEDMLCQMMDMIKPANKEYLVVEDFLQPHCSQVSGALFDALFNVNKHVMWEQRDPFLERQKQEDEFATDWDRFACIDYNRLAMEEEQREEEAMEVDWVTMDEGEEDSEDYNSLGLSGSSEAPF